MGGTIEQHVGKKIGLVNLTGICARRSDPNGNIVFNYVWKVVVRAVPGYRRFFEIPSVVCPQCAIFNEKYINRVSFFVTEFGELKTSCC